MELSDTKKNVEEKVKIDWKQVIFLVLIMVFICMLAFTIFFLIKNKELITTDAIVYGMKMHNFTSCSCIDSTGKFISFGKQKWDNKM